MLRKMPVIQKKVPVPDQLVTPLGAYLDLSGQYRQVLANLNRYMAGDYTQHLATISTLIASSTVRSPAEAVQMLDSAQEYASQMLVDASGFEIQFESMLEAVERPPLNPRSKHVSGLKVDLLGLQKIVKKMIEEIKKLEPMILETRAIYERRLARQQKS